MKINSNNNLKANSDCTNKNYSEAAAIQQLLATIDKTASDEQLLDSAQIKITVGDETVAFSFGGPQIEAIIQFCKQLEAENAYDIDLKNNTVECDDFWLRDTDYLPLTE